ALLMTGRFEEGLRARRRGHELGSRSPAWRYNSKQWVRDCERLVELERRFLKGDEKPADAAERAEVAWVCHLKRRHAAAARWYEEAFTQRPELARDSRRGYRYNAACAAALAGCGRGKDADKL